MFSLKNKKAVITGAGSGIAPARVHTPLLMFFCKKIIREMKRKCLKNYRKHNPLEEWQGQMKLRP